MTRVRRINVSQIEGRNANNTNDDEIRPFGEIGVYVNEDGQNDKPVLSMFDGTRTHLRSKVLEPGVLYGSNADSGDGAGLDTIKLIPDAALHYNGGSYGNDQYLVVDPTGGEPGHIHLRAGGTQDGSTADLYLGGELTCVRVSDNSDSVTIRTTNLGDPNMTMDWSFQPDGQLYFPGIISNRIGEGEPGLVLESGVGIALVANYLGDSKTVILDTNGNLAIPGTITSSESTGLTLGANYDLRIVTDYTDNNRTWTFEGSTGDLQLPFNGSIVNGSQAAVGSQSIFLLDYDGNPNNSGASGLSLAITEASQAIQVGWTATFTTGGTYTVQTISTIGDRLFIGMNDGFGFSADLPVTFASPDYAPSASSSLTIAVDNNDWIFGTDGNLTLPSGGDILDSNGVSVLGGGGTTLPANAAGYLVNDGAGNLSWAAGDGTFSGDYNDLVNKPTLPTYSTQGALSAPTLVLGAGTLSYTPTIETGIIAAGNHTGSYAGLTVQNQNTGATSSANIYFSNTGATETDNFAVIGFNGPNYDFGYDSVDGAKKLLYIANTDGDITLIPNYFGTGNIHLGYGNGSAAISVTHQGGLSLGTTWNNAGQTYVLSEGTAGQVLTSGGAGQPVSWTTVSGSGTTLPANAAGYLVNDGAGNLSWAAGDGTFSGDYDDLVNKPDLTVYATTAGLAAVATSGSYTDLLNQPTIPADVSDLTDSTDLLYSDSKVITLLSNFGSNSILTTGDVTANNVTAATVSTNTVTGDDPDVTLVAGTYSYTFDNTGTASLPGDLEVTGDATVSGTGSNIVRRVFGLVNFDTAVTLDDLSASVTSSTNQLALSTTGSWQGTGWTETYTTGSASVSSWVNLPLNPGYNNASGSMTSQGHGCRAVISDQTPSAKVYQITVVRSGTGAGGTALWNISIERLV